MSETRVITRAQAAKIDELATQKLGIPSLLLMENAAINACAVMLDAVDLRLEMEPHEIKAAVICGKGNNGGDGFAIARHLSNWGVEVTVYAATAVDTLSPDASINAQICQRMGLPIFDEPDIASWSSCELIVDALLGTGFSGSQVKAPLDGWIQAINGSAAKMVAAVDCPSGLNADTGQTCLATVRADLTVTFVEAKPGLIDASANRWVGSLTVADIGVPDELIDEAIDSGHEVSGPQTDPLSG